MGQSYEIYDFGLMDRPNFFLTKVLQKYRFFQRWDGDAFAYISVRDSRTILGQYNLSGKIDQLVQDGYIETRTIGTTRFNHPTVAYIPLVTEYKRTYDSAYFIYKYYDDKYSTLSIYGKEIVRGLRSTKILIPDWTNIFQECFAAYQAKGGNKSFSDYVSNLGWLQEEVEFFNNATNYTDYVQEDLFGHRVHSIISQLPRPMRKHVFIGGYPTVEVDLSQSQPMILAKYLEDKIGDNSFSRAVHSMDIYSFIQGELGLLNRELAKKILFRMIFGPSDTYMAKEFYHLFPDTKDFVMRLKSDIDTNNPSKKIYSNLAFKMQRTETDLFRIVWSKLMANRIPYLSIHDGLLVKIEDAERVKDYMTDILTRHLGPSAVVNIKM